MVVEEKATGGTHRNLKSAMNTIGNSRLQNKALCTSVSLKVPQAVLVIISWYMDVKRRYTWTRTYQFDRGVWLCRKRDEACLF